VLFPVHDPVLVRHLRDVVLGTYLADNVRARRMRPDGGYDRAHPAEGGPPIDAQAKLMQLAGTPPEGEGHR
jgi:polyphosphate kinase